MLHLRALARAAQQGELTRAALLKLVRRPYYIPEGTPLSAQLLEFQRHRRRTALVVDEYGALRGLLSLDDILEEIVGEFTHAGAGGPRMERVGRDTHRISGDALVRDINRVLGWRLPEDGPKTLSGLVVEHLETIPKAPVCLRLGDYVLETGQTAGPVIRSLLVRQDQPTLRRAA